MAIGPSLEDKYELLELMSILTAKPFDFHKYKEFGRVNGFNSFYGRNISWNHIMQISDPKFTKRGTFAENKKKTLAQPLEEKISRQIKVDVDRSLVSMDIFVSYTQSEIDSFRADLLDLLTVLFTLNKHFNYYQGFHDVATIFLYQLGKEAAFQALMHYSGAFQRDALSYPFEKSVTLQLKLIFKILGHFDKDYANHLSELYEGVPMFAIPWLLTWFSHSLNKTEDILRIFDFLLSSPPQTIIYMCAAVLITTKDDLYESADEIDMPAVHMFYQKLEISDVEFLIATTIEMERKCDIGMKVLSLDCDLPEGSLIECFESQKGINKYYKHSDRYDALEMLNEAKKSEFNWKKKMITNIGFAGLLVASAVAVYKTNIKKVKNL